MKIGGLIKFSLIDYPGQMAATLFTQGCNYRCPYCHNADLVIPQKFKEEIPELEIFQFLDHRKGKLKSVVITGGEPTLHQDLPEFIRKIKELGYNIKLDTNGSHPEMLRKILNQELVDYIAMDIKAPFDKYDLLTGIRVNLNTVKESIDLIAASGIAHTFRTTVVKSMLSLDDIQKMQDMIPQGSPYKLQEFVPRDNTLDPAFNTLPSEHYSKEELRDIQDSFFSPQLA